MTVGRITEVIDIFLALTIVTPFEFLEKPIAIL